MTAGFNCNLSKTVASNVLSTMDYLTNRKLGDGIGRSTVHELEDMLDGGKIVRSPPRECECVCNLAHKKLY